MSRQLIINNLKQSNSQETLAKTSLSLPLQRLCAQQSKLLLHHNLALQKTLDEIKTAFQKTEEVADGKAEETFEEETAVPRCILSYAWPSDPYQEKEAYLQPFLDFLYEHLASAGIEVHLDFREPEFDITGQRETIYDSIHRHYRPGTFIVLIGTESLRAQHDASVSGPMQFELDRLHTCLSQADGSVYPLLLSGTRDSAYPDDIAGYIKIQNAENLSYLNLLQQLIDRLYSQDTQNFWEAIETTTTLPENTEAISEVLSHQLHQSQLADLQQTPAYQTIQMQRQKKISECLSAKLFVAFQEAMGEPTKYIKDEYGFMFHCPPENENFIERPALSTKLNDYFLQPGPQLLTLTAQGLGGVGKTQLAQHVYLHPPQPYALRAWFQAGSREHLSLQYIDLGKAQGVKFADDLPIEEKVARVLRWLEQQPNCLLMYDDVPDKAMLEGLLPQKRSHILITTRHGRDWPVSQCLDVDVMELKEAKALIEEIAGEQDPTDLDTLVNMLGRLPLALAQAAWYMRQENCEAGAYLAKYEQHQKRLMQHTEGLPRSIKNEEKWEKHEAVWVTFDINFQELQQTCPEALLTLNQASWLASTPIPEILLQSIIDSEKTTMPERLFEWANIKGQLTAYSLMQVDVKAQTLRMHNLVQDILRDQQASNEKVELFKQTCDALDNLDTQCNQKGSLEYRVLLEHAECLYRHNTAITTLVSGIQDHEADLINAKPFSLGSIYLRLGMAKESLDVWQQQRVVFENYYGLNHPEVAITLMNLGIVYGELGDAEKQCELQEHALTIQKAHYGSDHIEVARTLANLGDAYRLLGYTKKAYSLQECALRIFKVHYGWNHPKVAKILVALGNTHGVLGNVKKQCELQEQALTIQEAHYGVEHPGVAYTLNNLGCAYGLLGDAGKQCELQSRALRINEANYSSDHPRIALVLMNLGTAYGCLGDAKKQYKLQKKALAIQEAYYGSDHPAFAKTLMNLGLACGALGDTKKQCKFLENALAIQKRYYGSGHIEVAKFLENLGLAYGALGDPEKQCILLERVLAIEEAYFSSDHPEVAKTMSNLGNAYGALGDAKKQCKLLESALTILEKHHAPNHRYVAKILNNLGSAYGLLDNMEKACESLERALIIMKSYYGSDHLEVAKTSSNLGSVYGVQGNMKKACKLQEYALAILEKYYGSNHPEVAKILNNLGSTYRVLGNPEKSCKFQEHALAILKKHYGSSDPVIAKVLLELAGTYGALGNSNKQCNLAARALAILEGHNSPNHLLIIATLKSLSKAYGSLGQIEKQCYLQRRVLEIQEMYYGSDHLKVASTLENLAIGYIKLNYFLRAIELFQRMRNIYNRHFPQGHPKLTAIKTSLTFLQNITHPNQSISSNQNYQQLSNQGLKHYNAKDYTAALPFFQQAIALQQKFKNPDTEKKLATCYFKLGSTLFFLERYGEARAPLENAYQLRLKLVGPEDRATQKARARLDAALEKLLDVALEELQSVEPEKRSKQQLAREGKLRFKVEDYAAALPFFQQALALQLQTEGSYAEGELAVCYFNLGSTLLFLKRYEEAIASLENAYQLRLKLVGPEDHATQRAKERLDSALEKLQWAELVKRIVQQVTQEIIQRDCTESYTEAIQKTKGCKVLSVAQCDEVFEENLHSVNTETHAVSNDEARVSSRMPESLQSNGSSIVWNRCTLFATGVVAVTAISAAWYLNEKTGVIDLFRNVLSGSVSP